MSTARAFRNIQLLDGIPRMEKEELKRAIKEAHKEWLNEIFRDFGKWSLGAISACALSSLIYFILQASGWHR